jgi:hypothetical protein
LIAKLGQVLRRKLGWHLADFYDELNDLARLKVAVLRPRDLERATHLLKLPRYAEANDPDEQLRLLHADLSWIVRRGLSDHDQASAQVILRPLPLAAELFVPGESPEHLEDREEALRRQLGWQIRKIKRDREPLLHRVAFALFQLGLNASPAFVRGFAVEDFVSSVNVRDEKERIYYQSFTITLLRQELEVVKNLHHFGEGVKVSPPTLIEPEGRFETVLALRETSRHHEYALFTSFLKVGEPTRVTIRWEAETKPRQVPFLDVCPSFPTDFLTLKVSASPTLVNFYCVIDVSLGPDELPGTATELRSRADQSPVVVTRRWPGRPEPLSDSDFSHLRRTAGYRLRWVPQ